MKNQSESLVAIKSIWWKINLTLLFHSPTHSLFRRSRFICFFFRCSCFCACYSLANDVEMYFIIYFISFCCRCRWKKLKWKSILDFIALKLDHIEESFFFFFREFTIVFNRDEEWGRKWERKIHELSPFPVSTSIFLPFSWYFHWDEYFIAQNNTIAPQSTINPTIQFALFENSPEKERDWFFPLLLLIF